MHNLPEKLVYIYSANDWSESTSADRSHKI